MFKLPMPRAEAQGLAEYGLILALVSLTSIVALAAIGVALLGALSGSGTSAASCMQNPQNC